jgi:hypothetical protein
VVANTKPVVLHDLSVAFGSVATAQGNCALELARSGAGHGGRATIIGQPSGAQPAGIEYRANLEPARERALLQAWHPHVADPRRCSGAL